jgi:3',5'-cyclic AMP phosphodiesterase CpdA
MILAVAKRFTSCAIFLLLACTSEAALLRGPYLQSGSPTSVIVRWRTDVAQLGRVQFGSTTNLGSFTDETVAATEHSLLLSDLAPDTTYFYSVGTASGTLARGADYFFRTSPPIGSHRPFRVWVLGDFGMTNQSAFPLPVRNAYYNYTSNRYTDLFLMLGDNAYHGGGDPVWQVAVFNTYSNILRQTPVWSTIGNQETGNSATAQPTTYLQNFTFPTNGEAGGLPSGTEKYYSFEFGNVHFVCLDSMSSARTNGSPMLLWLEEDLRQNTNEWLIVFFHHPPYSKGSNDSDVRQEQIQMRTNAVPLLEAYGVDLVLAGHSHSYERSYLLDGHYGFSTTFSNAMVLDSGDGRVDGSGAYEKPLLGVTPHAGAVYAVTGSGASLGGGPLNHPAMYRSINVLGSMVLDIHANRLDAKFLRETGVVDDEFTIIKGAGPLRVSATRAADGAAVLTWNSVANREYHIEFTPALLPTSWTNISGPLLATNVTTSWTGQTNAGFYRVWSAR